LPQNKQKHIPRYHKPNATRFVSNGHREREILQFVHKVKQGKKSTLTVQSVHDDVAGYDSHVAVDMAGIDGRTCG
jgi:hypothetical protein